MPTESSEALWRKKPAAFSWFPPHMHRAQKRLLAEIRTTDLVVEVRDARLPFLSSNPSLGQITQGTRRLLLFNKISLADRKSTTGLRRFFAAAGLHALFIDAESGDSTQRVISSAKTLLRSRDEGFRKRGIRPPPPRLMVIGIPNVGKSTIINRLIGGKRQQVGPEPGVTRASTWVPLKGRLSLLDSPGVLLPRIETVDQAYRLCWIGAVPDYIVGPALLATELLRYLLPTNSGPICRHYGLENLPFDDPDELLSRIAVARGSLVRGGLPDIPRAADLVLRDFRGGNLGRTTFEKISGATDEPARAQVDLPDGLRGIE